MLFISNKYLCLLVLLLCGGIGFSQPGISLQALKQKTQSDFSVRAARVNEFARKTSSPIVLNTSEGRHLLMVDVVDGIPVYISTLNSEAAITTGVTQIQSGGVTGLNLEGEGMLIGVWDEGSVKEHIELGARVISKEVDNAVTHATHVTGTIIASGVNPSAKGMAPKASVTNWYFNNDLAEMAALANPDDRSLLLSNHSYGTVTGWTKINGQWSWSGNSSISADEDFRFGFYGGKAAALDELANLAPYYTIVWAAGNDRGEPGDGSRPPDCNGGTGYDCIIPESVAKNIITVGAINKVLTYANPASVVMSSFSSWGPTDDGRIKPDLVGAGVNLFSLSADGDNTYAFSSGTSMATPNVTGSLALLQELYGKLHGGKVMKASTLKALAIHTAKEAGAMPGPDYQFGWGVLNVEAAAKLLVSEDGINTSVTEEKLVNGSVYEQILNPRAGQKITVTIAWNDPAAQPVNPSLDPISLMLVNDLDVKLIAEDGVTAYPWLLNPSVPSAQAIKGDNYRDNVEKLEFNLPEAKPYRLVVSHKGQLVNGSQDFSLVIKYQSSKAMGSTLYWVGDSGDWSDGAHWSFSSGGTPATIVPGSLDQIIIDENSFDGTGTDQIVLNQNQSVGTMKWLRSKPASLAMQGNTLTVTKDLVLANESFGTVGEGSIICSVPNGPGTLYFNGSDLGNVKLSIAMGDWQMQGKLSTDHLELLGGKLIISNSALTLNKLMAVSPSPKVLVINDTEIRLKEQSTFDASQLTFESSRSKLKFDNVAADLSWDGISFDGAFEITQSDVNVNGDIEVADLSIYHGSSLLLNAGSRFHADTISWLKGEENSLVTLSSSAKSSLSTSSHFLLCTDYLNISNVDFLGSSRIYAGLNSSIINSSNWQTQTCETALFADFDTKYLCQDGFTEFNNKSIGAVDAFDWIFENQDGAVIGSSVFENPFQSFDEAGIYTVSLTVSDKLTSHTFERQIMILPTSTGKNAIAVSSDNLVSLATSSSYQWFLNEQKIDGAVGRTYAYNGAEGVYRVVTYEGKCNRSSGLVTITGIEENTTQLKIYPNPVGDDLFIEFNSSYPAQATMTDLLGRTINSTFFNGSINIPVVHLTNGIYLLKIKAGGREIVKKIVVNH